MRGNNRRKEGRCEKIMFVMAVNGREKIKGTSNNNKDTTYKGMMKRRNNKSLTIFLLLISSPKMDAMKGNLLPCQSSFPRGFEAKKGLAL